MNYTFNFKNKAMSISTNTKSYNITFSKLLVTFITLLLNSLILNLVIELLWKGNSSSIIEWMNTRACIEAIFVILYFEISLLLIIPNTFFTAVLINITAYILSITNYFKLLNKSEVFQISDLSLIKEATNIISSINLHINSTMVFQGIILVLTLLFIFFIHKASTMHISKKTYIFTLLVGLFLLGSSKVVCRELNTIFHNEKNAWSPEVYYDNYGLVVGCIGTLPKDISAPKNYSKNTVAQAIDTMPYAPTSMDVKPNVIFIMNETMCDLYSFIGDKISSDPLSKFKQYQQDFCGGTLVTPSYGGYTSQVEFEVLSSYPSTNVDGAAYTTHIRRDMDSLATIYNKNGYESYSFHPNTASFYSRNKVYKYMGFNNILFPEDLKLPLEYMGNWATDRSLYDNMIYEIENRDNSKPYFMHAVTTQNHGTHNWDFTYPTNVTVNSTVSGEQAQIINTYANLLSYSDNALDYFIHYLENRNEPTILVIYGDHASSLVECGANVDYYTQRRTPLLIWNNYGLKLDDVGYIAAYKIGAYVTNKIGITNDPYINYMARPESPTVLNEMVYTPEGHLIPMNEWDNRIFDWQQKVWLMEYDRMFGKDYYNDLVKP